VPKDVRRQPDNHVVVNAGLSEADSVVDPFALLIELVLVDGIAIDHLVEEEDFFSPFEHHWVLHFEGEFELYLDVADGETIFQLKLRSLHHVFGALKHEVYLKFLEVEDSVNLLNVYLGFLSDHSPLAHVAILDVEKVYFVDLFGQEPLTISQRVALGLLGPTTGLKRVEVEV
jgi:hypothetical protein